MLAPHIVRPFEDNPPCTCTSTTADYRCFWCPHGEGARDKWCICQIQWIFQQAFYDRGPGMPASRFPRLRTATLDLRRCIGEGTGICIRCVQNLLHSGRYSPVQQIARMIGTLNVVSERLRENVQACMHNGSTREMEVQGHLLLSSSIEDREVVEVRVQRPRGMVNGPRGLDWRSRPYDSTVVEYRLDPYDRDGQHMIETRRHAELHQYLREGFRSVHNAFDWDQPDAVMERSNVEIITEE